MWHIKSNLLRMVIILITLSFVNHIVCIFNMYVYSSNTNKFYMNNRQIMKK